MKKVNKDNNLFEITLSLLIDNTISFIYASHEFTTKFKIVMIL